MPPDDLNVDSFQEFEDTNAAGDKGSAGGGVMRSCFCIIVANLEELKKGVGVSYRF